MLQVVHLLTISSEFAKLRLRMLFTCYNSIPVTSKTGHLSKSIFFSTLEFAKEQKIFGVGFFSIVLGLFECYVEQRNHCRSVLETVIIFLTF